MAVRPGTYTRPPFSPPELSCLPFKNTQRVGSWVSHKSAHASSREADKWTSVRPCVRPSRSRRRRIRWSCWWRRV